MGIIFLDLDDVLTIHTDQISRYGGSVGLRSQGLLESAIMMPRASFAGRYAHDDLYVMAAAYLYHIVMNSHLSMATNALALSVQLSFWH